jgi:hypothetical protein
VGVVGLQNLVLANLEGTAVVTALKKYSHTGLRADTRLQCIIFFFGAEVDDRQVQTTYGRTPAPGFVSAQD